MKLFKKLFVFICLLCLTAALVQFVPSQKFYAAGQTQTIKFSTLANDTYTSGFDFTDSDLARYVLKHGSVQSLNDFDAGTTNDIYTQAAGIDGVRAQNWIWKVTRESGIVAVFEMKTDAKITISIEGEAKGYLEHTKVSIYIQSKSELKLVKSSKITPENKSDITLYGGEFHIKEGDILYYEFTAPEINPGQFRNMQTNLPTLFIDEDAFDLVEYEKTFPSEITTQTTNFSQMATATYGANFGMASGPLFDYGLKYGLVANLKDFDMGGVNDIYTQEEGEDGVRARNWMWTITPTSGIIAVFEIKADSKITIVRNYRGGFEDNTIITIYIYSNSKLTALKKSEITAQNKTDLSLYGIECYAKAGDIIYYEFKAPTINAGTTRNMQTPANQDDSLPIITASTEDFDQEAYEEMFRIKQESAGLVEMVEKAVIANGGTVNYSLFDVDFYGGILGEELWRYTAEKVTREDGSFFFQLVDEEGKHFDDSISAFQTWRMRASTESHAIIAVTAKENIFLKLEHPQLDGGWTDPKMGIFLGVYQKADGKYYTLLEVEPSNSAPANAYAVTTHMKQGDTLYFVYGTLMRSCNINIRPQFTALTEEYSEEGRQAVITANTKKLTLKEMVSNFIANELEEVTTQYFKYAFIVGDFYGDDLLAPSYYRGTGEGLPTDSVWDSASLSAGFERSLIKFGGTYNAIIKVTALENMLLKMTHPAIWPDALDAAIMIVAEDARGYKWPVSDKQIIANSEANYYLTDVHMKEGDSVYIVVYALTSSGFRINLMPEFEADIDAYDESLRPDFERAKVLEDYRQNIIQELEDHMEELGESNYSAARWSEILLIFDNARNQLKRAGAEEDMDEIKAEAITAMNQVKTLQQDMQELNAYKQEKIQELEAYINSLGKKKYTKDNWAKVQEELENFKTKIEPLKNKAAIDTAFVQSKAWIDNIPQKNGCSSGDSAVKLAFVTVALAGYSLIRKRRIF
ncbi:MAG TPA: hypothetical protein VIL24_02770 [Clostridia bacterium]